MTKSAENRFVRQGKKLVGLQIAAIRYMTEEERRLLFIGFRAVVLTLSDGTLLYPMADDEGNEAGALVALASTGEQVLFPVLQT